jgi:hypothetical protein
VGVRVILSSTSFTPCNYRTVPKQKNVDRWQSHILFALGIVLLALHNKVVHRTRPIEQAARRRCNANRPITRAARLHEPTSGARSSAPRSTIGAVP